MLTLDAPAKINLGLQVLYKRDDGFREINTIFAPICIKDKIKITNNPELSVDCYGSAKIPEPQNLVFQTGKLIQKYFDCKSKGAKITLEKNIPVGAGLGGGSSDAAAAINGLIAFWNLNADYEDKFKIALQLGSDVPFFLRNGLAEASGRGEILKYFDFELPFSTLIVNPRFQISTKWAYESLSLTKDKRKADFKTALLKYSVKDLDNLQNHIFNDFEPTLFEKYPVMKNIKETLLDCGARLALTSGSGSSLFGLFDEKTKLEKAKSELEDYSTYVCLKD